MGGCCKKGRDQVDEKKVPTHVTNIKPAVDIVAQPQVELQGLKHDERNNNGRGDADQLFILKDILDVLNDVRQNPNKYVDKVQSIYLDHMDERGLHKVTRILANEGRKSFEEAKTFLKNEKPRPPMKLDPGLTSAAYLHSVYAAEINELTHNGRGGTNLMTRIKEFGQLSSGSVGENILNNDKVLPINWILDFVIDDGVSSRGHRNNIFSDNYEKVGLGIARKSDKSDWYFTMDFASAGYRTQDEKITREVREKSGLAYYEKTNK